MSKEAIKLAIEALQYPLNTSHEGFNVDMAELLAHRAIKALEAALAKQEQDEPVAYINIEKRRLEWAHDYMSWDTPTVVNLPRIPLYTTPQPKRENGEPVAWTENDMAYRPNGLPQEFIHHEVESHDDWSEWVCPKPEQYFLKCCDCGLVHEAQFRVAKYGEGDYCELVEDKDTQAQFRMRRRTNPQQRTWVGLTDEECREIREEANLFFQPEETRQKIVQELVEAKLKEKNTP